MSEKKAVDKAGGKVSEGMTIDGGGAKKASAEMNKVMPEREAGEKTRGKVKMYLDTSTPVTVLRINEREYRWESGRELAEKLLGFIRDKLAENGAGWEDIGEITFMTGPGSFTGLRIGAAVVNTLAHELGVPLRDHHGKRVPIILPKYGRGANITKPRK